MFNAETSSSDTVRPLIIYGGGGHGKTLLELVQAAGIYRVAGIVDDGLAQGSDILGVPVSNTVTAAIELKYTASIGLTKVPSIATANVGQTVTYTFGVENTGDITINSLTLSDPKSVLWLLPRARSLPERAQPPLQITL